MLKQFFRMWRCIATGVISASLLVACAQKESCDLTKELDLTISVGKDLAFPVGSTGKIVLSDLIDPSNIDILEVDTVTGDYSLVKSGAISPVKFSVGTLYFSIAAASERQHFELKLMELPDTANLPSWIIEEMKKMKYPYVAKENVEYVTSFDVCPEVPSEIKKLRHMSLANNVKLELELKVYSEEHESDDVLELAQNIHFESDEADGLVVHLPKYLVFTENSNVDGGRLVLNGSAKYNAAQKALIYKKELFIEAIDFSHLPGGYIDVDGGVMRIHDELTASGRIVSDTIMLGYNNVIHKQSVDIECNIKMGSFVVDEIEGVFDPELELVKECVDLNLGDGLDFLKNAYFDFQDPRIFFTLNNPVEAMIFANASFAALDGSGQVMDGSAVNVDLNFMGNAVNNFFINRHGATVDGYTTVTVPELNNIMKRIPEKIEVALTAAVEEKFSRLPLGRDYEVAGTYSLALPMAFDSLRIVYVETTDGIMDEVNGSGDKLADYIGEVEALSLSFDLYNTVPFGITPDIKGYDSEGNLLETIKLEMEGSIEKGNGVVNGVVTEPVVSHVKVKLSATELSKLDRVDISLTGVGSGVFNAKEYIQLKNIVLSIDEPVSVDLKDLQN